MTDPTPALAEGLAANVPVCSDCLEHDGLCVVHAKGILPQLAQPFWYQLVGTHHYAKAPTESPEGRAIRERKERKRTNRLARALNGEYTRSRAA